MGYIYLITNKETKKQYVGQTICKDVEKRWRQHRKCDGNTIGRYLLAAYNKYGIENFTFRIICICFDKDCNKFEEEYINKFNTLVPNGYNLRAGGMNSKQHPESIQKIIDKLKGRRLTPITNEIRNKISESLKLEKNPNYGKKLNDEKRKILSDKKKEYWHINKDKKVHINSLTNLHTNSILNMKKVGQYDMDNNLIKLFESITEASIITNTCHSTISKICNKTGKNKTAGGFIWKFLPDQLLTS
jgi:group I intron endonuclease